MSHIKGSEFSKYPRQYMVVTGYVCGANIGVVLQIHIPEVSKSPEKGRMVLRNFQYEPLLTVPNTER